MKQPPMEWESMFKRTDDGIIASEDGEKFVLVNPEMGCPWNCGKPSCWWTGGNLEHELVRHQT